MTVRPRTKQRTPLKGGRGSRGHAQRARYEIEEASESGEEASETESEDSAAAEESEEEPECVPVKNVRDIPLEEWRGLRRHNPYRHKTRVNDVDPRFWTFTQQKCMEDVYDTFSSKKRYVKPKSLNRAWFDNHALEHFPHICPVLEALGL